MTRPQQRHTHNTVRTIEGFLHMYFLGGTGCVEIAASKGVGEGAKKKGGFNWFAAASHRVCESGPGTVDPVSPGPRGQQMEG